MKAELENMQMEDLPFLERDLNFAQKVSLAFLLFGDSHGHATYILQKLLALARAPMTEQLNSDLLRQYAQTNPSQWRFYLLEALCIIDARKVLRKLGFSWLELRLHYLPHVTELTLHLHPLLKVLYVICEQLTEAQSGRLVLDVHDKLTRRQQEESLRFYDFSYLEIFLLDWLTRRHLQLGDINAMGSDVQLLIEYFKFNDMSNLSTLLIETVNSNATPLLQHKCETYDTAAERDSVSMAVPVASPVAAPVAAPVKTEVAAPAAIDQLRRSNALQVRQENAGILLIINQHEFHRDVSEDLRHLLPSASLAKRTGTDADRKRISEVFAALGYSVEAHDNVDHLQMLDLIRSACSRSLLRDSLIVCIMSHGFEGAVYGADSVPLSIVDIKNVLCADENLKDKPKLLIIQACQQDDKNMQTCKVNARTQSPTQHANMVVAMSTVHGFAALRHSIEGSWFIQTLCDAVTQNAASEHVLDILTIAIGEVSKKRGDKNQKMLPLVVSTLKQNVYFPAI